jgi:hypothetical protein
MPDLDAAGRRWESKYAMKCCEYPRASDLPSGVRDVLPNGLSVGEEGIPGLSREQNRNTAESNNRLKSVVWDSADSR